MHSKRTGHVCGDVPRPGSATAPLVLSVPGPQPEQLQTWDLRWQGCSPPSPSTSTELGSRKDLNSINKQAHSADSNSPSSIGVLFHERGNYVGDNKARRLDQAGGHGDPKGGFFEDKVEQGRYGPIFPKTPACYGFSVIAKVIPGREEHLTTMPKSSRKPWQTSRRSPCSSCTT